MGPSVHEGFEFSIHKGVRTFIVVSSGIAIARSINMHKHMV